MHGTIYLTGQKLQKIQKGSVIDVDFSNAIIGEGNDNYLTVLNCHLMANLLHNQESCKDFLLLHM